MANVFDNEMMNAYFNKLPGDKQSTLLQMPKEQRDIVMRSIMEKSARQNNIGQQGQQGQQGGNGLTDMFTRLPLKYQVDALGSQYKTIATAFNKLGGDISKPTIQIIDNKEDPIKELRARLNLDKTDIQEDKPNKIEQNTENSSQSSSTTSNSEIKTINII